VLGDNRDNSEDSRYWGFVDPHQVTGRPWFIYYSVDLEEDGRFSWLRYIRWDRIGGIIRCELLVCRASVRHLFPWGCCAIF
jgi:signal peptidase I